MSFLQNSLQQDKGIPGAVKEVGLAAEMCGPPAWGVKTGEPWPPRPFGRHEG